MREDKFIAIKLRKEGNSYNQISKKLGIPKSTLSFWLADLKISTKALQKIQERVHKGSLNGLIKRNKNQILLAKKRGEEAKKAGKQEVNRLFKNPLFLIGTSLYWAEGYKKGAYGSKWKAVDFANSDPELVKIIMKFYKKICKINDKKIKVQLIAHKNINIDKALNYWSNITKLPKSQFIKTCCSVSKSSKAKRNKNSLTHGTVHIRINDVKLFFRIIGWIDGLKSKI